VNIDWLALVVVALVSILAAAVTVTLIATGIKLLAVPPAGSAAVTPARDDETDDVAAASRPAMATVGGIVCFTLGSLVVLFGVWLIIPFFHGG
jgi:hypothetical protein